MDRSNSRARGLEHRQPLLVEDLDLVVAHAHRRIAQDARDVVVAEQQPLVEQGQVDRIVLAHLREVGVRILDVAGLEGVEEARRDVRHRIKPNVGPCHARRLATNGIELDVIDAGTPGDPVVVLVHGFPESSHSWRHQIEPLVAAGYRVLVPDQRGYGESSAPRTVEAYRLGSPRAPTSSVCSTTSAPTDALFVGHDWGSMVVWDLARLHPEPCPRSRQRQRAVHRRGRLRRPISSGPCRATGSSTSSTSSRSVRPRRSSRPTSPRRCDSPCGAARARCSGHHRIRSRRWRAPASSQSITRGAAVPDGLPTWITCRRVRRVRRAVHHERILRTAELVPQPRRRLRDHQGPRRAGDADGVHRRHPRTA